jgi:hypothetical protein
VSAQLRHDIYFTRGTKGGSDKHENKFKLKIDSRAPVLVLFLVKRKGKADGVLAVTAKKVFLSLPPNEFLFLIHFL